MHPSPRPPHSDSSVIHFFCCVDENLAQIAMQKRYHLENEIEKKNAIQNRIHGYIVFSIHVAANVRNAAVAGTTAFRIKSGNVF